MTELLEILLRVTVLLLAAIAVAVAMRRSSAAMRHLVWTLSLAGTLLIPPFYWAFPAWRWAILPPPAMSATGDCPDFHGGDDQNLPTRLAAAKMGLSPSPDATGAAAGMPSSEWDTVGQANRGTQPAMPTPVSPKHSITHQAMPSWPVFFAAVWVVGTVVGLAWLAVGVVGAWHVARRARSAGDSPWPHVLEQLLRQTGCRRPVEVRKCSRVSVPMTWGLRRPVILAPLSSAAWSEATIRSVLLHELGHIRRADCLTHLLGRVACAAYWFHPLVWVAARQMRKTSEQAADDAVLSANIAPPDYAEHLVGIAGQMRGLHLFSHVALPMASPSDLEGRVLAILDPARNRRSLKRKTCYALMFFATLLLLPCALLRLGYAEDKKLQEPTSSDKDRSHSELNTPSDDIKLGLRTIDSISGNALIDVPIAVHAYDYTKRQDINTTLRTDANGKASVEIKNVRRLAGIFSVTVRPNGYAPRRLVWQPHEYPQSFPERLTLQFERGISIGGNLQDELGRPVVDATVEIEAHDANSHFSHGTVPVLIEKVVSDQYGKWRCNIMPERMAGGAISVRHPDFISTGADTLEEMKQFQHVLTLKRGGLVDGQVVDKNGSPIEGVKVSYSAVDDGAITDVKAKTDAQGRFQLKQCHLGNRRIVVWAKGYAPQSREINIALENKPILFTLEPGATIRGRIVDQQGVPVHPAKVFIESWHNIRWFSLDGVTVGKDGRFVWDSAPHDEVLLGFVARGWMRKKQTLATSEEEQNVILQPELAIRGTVADAQTGKPIDRFSFSLDADWERGASVIHNNLIEGCHGVYEIRMDEPCPAYYVRVQAQGYESAVSRRLTATDGQQTYNFRLKRNKAVANHNVGDGGQLTVKTTKEVSPAAQPKATTPTKLSADVITVKKAVNPNGKQAAAHDARRFHLVRGNTTWIGTEGPPLEYYDYDKLCYWLWGPHVVVVQRSADGFFDFYKARTLSPRIGRMDVSRTNWQPGQPANITMPGAIDLPAYQLLAQPSVERALNLSDEQRAKLQDISAKYWPERRRIAGKTLDDIEADSQKKMSEENTRSGRDGSVRSTHLESLGSPFSQEVVEELERQWGDARRQIEDVLAPEQLRTLKDLTFRTFAFGGGVMFEPEVLERLGVSKDRQEKLRALELRLQKEKDRRLRSVTREKMKKMLFVLTPQQLSALRQRQSLEKFGNYSTYPYPVLPSHMPDSGAAEELGLSDEQCEHIREIITAYWKSSAEFWQEEQKLSLEDEDGRKAIGEKRQQKTAEHSKQIEAVLTPEQWALHKEIAFQNLAVPQLRAMLGIMPAVKQAGWMGSVGMAMFAMKIGLTERETSALRKIDAEYFDKPEEIYRELTDEALAAFTPREQDELRAEVDRRGW